MIFTGTRRRLPAAREMGDVARHSRPVAKRAVTNVSIRVEDSEHNRRISLWERAPTRHPDETMRREGYELMVASPEMLWRTENSRRLEPVGELIVDCPSVYRHRDGTLARRGEVGKS